MESFTEFDLTFVFFTVIWGFEQDNETLGGWFISNAVTDGANSVIELSAYMNLGTGVPGLPNANYVIVLVSYTVESLHCRHPWDSLKHPK